MKETGKYFSGFKNARFATLSQRNKNHIITHCNRFQKKGKIYFEDERAKILEDLISIFASCYSYKRGLKNYHYDKSKKSFCSIEKTNNFFGMSSQIYVCDQFKIFIDEIQQNKILEKISNLKKFLDQEIEIVEWSQKGIIVHLPSTVIKSNFDDSVEKIFNNREYNNTPCIDSIISATRDFNRDTDILVEGSYQNIMSIKHMFAYVKNVVCTYDHAAQITQPPYKGYSIVNKLYIIRFSEPKFKTLSLLTMADDKNFTVLLA